MSSFIAPGLSDEDIESESVEAVLRPGSDEALSSREGLHLAKTSKVYLSYIKRFNKFFDINMEGAIPRAILTDDTFSVYFKSLRDGGTIVSYLSTLCVLLVNEFNILGLNL